MNIIWNPAFLEHDTGHHPESAERLKCLGEFPVTPIDEDEAVLSLVHREDYINKIRKLAKNGNLLDPDTVISKGSFRAAVVAANASIYAAETGGFALTRPPGHHAYSGRGTGFCLFNNIAIATSHLLKQGKRVLIFDFDGHNGDGTSAIFYDNPNVLYFSIHQFPAFPFKGQEHEIGSGEGEGYTINMTMPPYAGDDILFDSLKALLPILKQFKPDIVGISAGFDSHFTDPLLQLRWSTDAYFRLGKLIREHFSKYFAVLEGGYNTDILPACIEAFNKGIIGKKFRSAERHTDSEILVWNEYELRYNNLINNLKPYWDI